MSADAVHQLHHAAHDRGLVLVAGHLVGVGEQQALEAGRALGLELRADLADGGRLQELVRRRGEASSRCSRAAIWASVKPSGNVTFVNVCAGGVFSDVDDVAHRVLRLQLVVAGREDDLALALGVPAEDGGAGDEALASRAGRDSVSIVSPALTVKFTGLPGDARRVELAHQPKPDGADDEDHHEQRWPSTPKPSTSATGAACGAARSRTRTAPRGVPRVGAPVLDGRRRLAHASPLGSRPSAAAVEPRLQHHRGGDLVDDPPARLGRASAAP